MPPSSACEFVLVGLANHARPDGTGAFPSVATLVRSTGLAERTVHTHQNQLRPRHVTSPMDMSASAALASPEEGASVVGARELLALAAGIAADFVEPLGDRLVFPDVTPEELRKALGGPLPDAPLRWGHSASVFIGPRRILLWSALVVNGHGPAFSSRSSAQVEGGLLQHRRGVLRHPSLALVSGDAFVPSDVTFTTAEADMSPLHGPGFSPRCAKGGPSLHLQ